MNSASAGISQLGVGLVAVGLVGSWLSCAHPAPAGKVAGQARDATPRSSLKTNAPSATPAPSAPLSPPSAPPPEPIAPGPAPEPPKLNVIVLTIDALRADMPWAGYPKNIAPRLTALEKESVSYTRAYALSSYTAMSMGGFLAGRYPGELKRSGYFFSSHPEEELMFPELLQDANIRTLSAHAHFYFEKKSGFHQGFDAYRMVPNISQDNTTDKNVTSPQHIDLAIEMLSDATNTAGQFFAWFHLMDPHDRYVKHEGFRSFGRGGMRDRYDGEVYFTDHHVGRFLDFIAKQTWGDRTAIIVSADHGEAFGEHRMTRHGFELWESLVHVPLFMKIPGVAPQRIDKARGHIDLAPTIFDLLGVPAPEAFQGQSLLPEAKGETAPETRDVILDLPRTSDNFRRRALIHGRYKLIAYGDDFRYKLFDIIDDPGEKRDLRGRKKDVYKDMKRRYKERVNTIKDICPKMRHKLKGKRPENRC